MNKQVRSDDEATAELAEALRWYEDRLAGLGGRFLAAIDRAIEFIGEFPAAGTKLEGIAHELGVRRFAVGGFPYHLVYLEMDEQIRILAFAHDSREPEYWVRRLDSGS